MGFIQLIYNPMAGQRYFPLYLDRFVEIFQEASDEVRVFRTSSPDDFSHFLDGKDLSDCDAVIVAGGDGSINRVINSMLHNGQDVPIGVIPAGTANDFAMHLGVPQDPIEAMKKLARMKIDAVDIGQANQDYFINVCCGGLFSNISQNIDVELKNTLGKLAYYIKGVQQLPKFTRLKLKISHEEGVIVDDYYLFLLLNGSSAGGFGKLGLDANISDGRMDFVGIKACPVSDIPALFGKILMGDHLTDKNITFFQTKDLKIEVIEGVKGFEESDIDGEAGPLFPLDIKVHHRRLRVLSPK